MYLLLLVRGIMNNNFLFRTKAARAIRKLHDSVARRNPKAIARPIPEIHFDTLCADTFRSQYCAPCRPFVIKGFPLAAAHWNLSWFIDNYATTNVLFTDSETGEDFNGPLSLLRSQRSPYLHNSQRIIRENPEVLRDLKLQKISKLLGQYPYSVQLFLGNHVGSGSPYHCAEDNNFFLQIEGRKRWTFVDPNHTLLLYPYLTMKKSYEQCLVTGLHGADEAERFPLYTYCPRYEVTLEPGDVVYTPSWWWHSVENMTRETIGVATRWHAEKDLLTNRLFTILYWLSPYQFSLSHRDQKKGVDPKFPGATLYEVQSHDSTHHDIRTGKADASWLTV